MKTLKYFVFISFAAQLLYAQSSIVIGTGASIDVGLGADICAGSITGTVTGDGTKCGSPLLKVLNLTTLIEGFYNGTTMVSDTVRDTYLANIRKARMEDEMRSSWTPPDPEALHKAVNAAEQDPNGRKPNEPGAKLDSGKTMPWLCIAGFSRALEEVAKVTTLGAQKYTPNGWASVPEGSTRYMEAFGRHLLKFGQGEIKDTGPNGLGDVYHKAQMIWNLLASLELELREKNG